MRFTPSLKGFPSVAFETVPLEGSTLNSKPRLFPYKLSILVPCGSVVVVVVVVMVVGFSRLREFLGNVRLFNPRMRFLFFVCLLICF